MHKSPAAVVRAILDAITQEDMGALMANLDERIEVIEPESLPCGGTHRGIDDFRKNVLMTVGRKFRVRILRSTMIAENDVVAACADIEFTARNSNQSLVMPYVELYSVFEGKVRRIEVYPQDTHRLLQFWNQS
jgi:ketosteroid isomerase-like protein